MLKIVDKKRFYLFVTLTVLLVAALIFGLVRLVRERGASQDPANQPAVYDALVNLVDQQASDPAEDARASLKRGDVIAYFPEGHDWSETERISYLILKIRLKPDDAVKLTQSETKEQKSANPEQKEPEQVTVRARLYHIDLGEIGAEKLTVNDLAGGQPLKDKVFDDRVLEKK